VNHVFDYLDAFFMREVECTSMRRVGYEAHMIEMRNMFKKTWREGTTWETQV